MKYRLSYYDVSSQILCGYVHKNEEFYYVVNSHIQVVGIARFFFSATA